MRRDYVEPDDFEYEPTPHDEVLKRAQEHTSSEQRSRDQGTGDGAAHEPSRTSRCGESARAGTGRR